MTRWGRAVDPEAPLPEHPRPQRHRATWCSLNGVWEHAFTADPTPPTAYDGPVVVPFSPEAPLSGVGRQLRPDEWLWYRRTLTTPDVEPGGRVLLHLGAVDQQASVRVDGVEVGGHTGGYLPFTLDVTDALGSPGSAHELVVRVRDRSETAPHARGKQRLDRGEIWYTAQSGIWQTVWLEWLPARHVADLRLTPRLSPDLATAALEVHLDLVGDGTATVVVSTTEDGEVARAQVGSGATARLPLRVVRPWSPEHPHLYDVTVTHGEDHVTSYTALRTLGTGRDTHGHPRLLLNGRPYPHVGVLDQGYWPDGLLTAPSDAAMVHDITTMKDLGFTVLRKHAKVEPLRWYAHCDRLGMLVWQDVVNGGGRYRALTTTRPARLPLPVPDRLHALFGRQDADGRAELTRELHETVDLLDGSPSVVVWTLFNEGWGQFDANAHARAVRRQDPTRPVNHVSGWVDQGGGDVRSFHAYLAPFTMPRLHRPRRWRRVVALTEYGGHSLRVDGHDWSDREFGYRHHADAAALTAAFEQLHEGLVGAARDGLAATVWTQLSDVEDELNGLLTYDREVLKPDADVVRAVTARLRAAMTDSAGR
ncbi:glycoside hydrolase family 2 protein [Nocardioides aurantiacus]|uniref:Glycosyl hydrolase family 2 n=1 Tax=Nocardioides aurantiacus TaxID=86796 RepID=A0A3N2CQD6_9ACTN|nr:glycoside hydrolase family 2 TIM barrel-domain containing protein [Nocardioides aurantiacus]ROR89737.1 glycosyl hydrolase family 2 [Nocardioides aurantiacus]